jgi:hypothetical protein
MKYIDMVNMSPAEIDKLSPQLQEELEAWMEKQVNQGKETVASKTAELEETNKTLASILEKSRQLDATLASIDQVNEKNSKIIAQKWNEYSLTLQSIDIQQVAHFFKTSVPDGKAFLEYVVKNNLPPPGFAQKVLNAMN